MPYVTISCYCRNRSKLEVRRWVVVDIKPPSAGLRGQLEQAPAKLSPRSTSSRDWLHHEHANSVVRGSILS